METRGWRLNAGRGGDSAVWSSLSSMIRLFGSVLCVAASCASCSDARTNRTSAAEDRLPAIEALQADGLYEETIDELRLMLDVQPDLPRASHLLGVAYLHTGQGGRAVWPLMRASRHPGFERDSGLLLAAVLASSQNWEAAADEADLVLTVAPGDREALLLRAEARLGLRDPEAALPDLERAVESDPRDSRALAMRARVLEEVGRIEDAQRAYDAMLEVTVETRDPLAATRACLVRAGFLVRTSPDAESTVLAVLSCVEAWSDDVAALAGASALLLELEREDDAIELWLSAAERMPTRVDILVALAGHLERAGRLDQAAAVWHDATTRIDTAPVWQMYADHLRRVGRIRQAQQALERAISLAGDQAPALLRLTEGDLLVELGELGRAQAIADDLEDPTLAQLLRARILAERGDAEGTLEALDIGLAGWPDNSGARVLAARAARHRGDVDRALEEYRAAVRADSRSPSPLGAALAAAQLHFDLGEFSAAESLLRLYRTQRDHLDPEADLLQARILTASGRVTAARNLLNAIEQGWERQRTSPSRDEPGTPEVLTGRFRRALLIARADADRRTAGPAAAARRFEQSGLDWDDPINEPILALWLADLARLGQTDQALALVGTRILARPDRPLLHDLRGRLLLNAGRFPDAEAAFRREGALPGGMPRALLGLATLSAARGDVAAALPHLEAAEDAIGRREKAGAVDDSGPDAQSDPGWTAEDYYRAAQIWQLAARNERARASLETALRLQPGHPDACNDLAWLLAQAGVELDRAEVLARRSLRFDPGDSNKLDTLETVKAKKIDPPRRAPGAS